MKRLFYIFAIGALSMGGCTYNDTGDSLMTDDSSIHSLNGTWKVVYFEDHSNHSVEYKTDTNSWGFDIVITFDDTQDPKTISGKNTTNSVFGNFSYTGERSFKVHQLGSTYVNQPEWGNKFASAILDNEPVFEITHTRLRIYYDNMRMSMMLQKQ